MPDIAVLGLGLIGGSLLLRLRELGYAVSAYDVDARTREAAGAVDSVAEAVADADIAVVAVPLPALEGVLSQLTGFEGVLTDVTSVKKRPAELAKAFPRYVGGHPMSGTERSGFAAADAGLFTGRTWVLCLDAGTSLDDWLTLADLYTRLGARVVPTTAAEHDEAVAAISHLPHLVANALVVDAPLELGLAAGSFRDGTRVAATRAELTAAMCGGNAEALGRRLDAFIADLSEARRLLDDADPIAALTPWLARGQRVRAGWPPSGGAERVEPATVEGLLALGRDGGWMTGVVGTVTGNGQSVRTVRPTDR